MKCSILCGKVKFKRPEDPPKAAGAKKAKLWEELDWAEREHIDGDASERALLIFNEKRLKEFNNMGLSTFDGHSKIRAAESSPNGPLTNLKFQTLKTTLPDKPVLGQAPKKW